MKDDYPTFGDSSAVSYPTFGDDSGGAVSYPTFGGDNDYPSFGGDSGQSYQVFGAVQESSPDDILATKVLQCDIC